LGLKNKNKCTPTMEEGSEAKREQQIIGNTCVQTN
jgi:hypothetical protein